MPDIDWSNVTVKEHSSQKHLHYSFLNSLDEFHLSQIITEPTHILGNVLDLVCTSNPENLSDCEIVNPGLSDHFMITMKLLANITLEQPKPRIIKQYWKADTLAIKESLETLRELIRHDIQLGKPINEIWDVFEQKLQKAIELYVPVKRLHAPKPSEPLWFNTKARALVTKQRKLYNKYKKTGLIQHHDAYKLLRRENKKLFRKMESDFMFHTLYQPMQKGNSKPFYSHVKRLKGSSNQISEIENKQKNLVEDPSEIANILNDFFHSVFGPQRSVTAVDDYDLTSKWGMTIDY